MAARARDALVLVGHGSARNPHSRVPTLRIADAIRARGVFAEVHACFLKEAPFLDDALDAVDAEQVFVVPNFAGHGQLTREVLPARMGLTGALTRRGTRLVHYTPPVGAHPAIPALLGRRAVAAAAEMACAPPEAALLLIAHGSSRPGGSGETPAAVAADLRRGFPFGEVAVAYLEQEPFLQDWPRLVSLARVVAAPLLVAEGMHGSEDIPPSFGLRPGDTGPVRCQGRTVRLCRGIGSDPEVVDLVLDLVATARGGQGRVAGRD